MTRPRWHDVLITAAIAGVLAVGVWALWWDDVRSAVGWDHGSSEPAPVPVTGPTGET
jgi:hypothetical protein